MHEKRHGIFSGSPLNPWDGWEGYFGQRGWHKKMNSTNEIPIAFLNENHEETPHFAWMQEWWICANDAKIMVH